MQALTADERTKRLVAALADAPQVKEGEPQPSPPALPVSRLASTELDVLVVASDPQKEEPVLRDRL